MKNKVDLEFYTRLQYPGLMKANPSRRAVAFTLSRADMKENTYPSSLWLYDGRDLRKLSPDPKLTSFIWEDDKNILFAGQRGEAAAKEAETKAPETVYYRLRIDGGEAEKAFTLPFAVERIEALGDRLYLVLASLEEGLEDSWLLKDEERQKRFKDENELSFRHLMHRIPFYTNGGGFCYKKSSALFIFDADSAALCRLSTKDLDVSGFSLSEDKKRCIVMAQHMAPRQQLTNGVWQIKLPDREALKGQTDLSSELRELYPDKDYNLMLVWEAEPRQGEASRLLALATDMARYGCNESPKLYELSHDGAELKQLSDEEIQIWDALNTDLCPSAAPGLDLIDGHLYFTHSEGTQTVLCRISPAAKLDRLYRAPGAIASIAVMADRILCCGLFNRQAPELYALVPGDQLFTAEKVSAFNEKVMSETEFATLVHVNGESGDDPITGYVLLPADYDETKRYPAILDIHGGPRTIYGEILFHEMEYWAANGYIVLFCNPHGSDGLGDAFADIRGRYGEIDYEDIMAFVDRVLARFPQIDPQRLGVTGGSYGGFMSNWIIGHTDRFAACATQRSIMNWTSFYGVSDIGYFFATDQNATDTFSQAGFSKLWEHSPMKYINAAKTPTLIIHSDEDYRCPLEQGLQLYTALVDRGVPTEMVLFKGENHELSRSGKPKARRERLDRITRWMDRYLKA